MRPPLPPRLGYTLQTRMPSPAPPKELFCNRSVQMLGPKRNLGPNSSGPRAACSSGGEAPQHVEDELQKTTAAFRRAEALVVASSASSERPISSVQDVLMGSPPLVGRVLRSPQSNTGRAPHSPSQGNHKIIDALRKSFAASRKLPVSPSTPGQEASSPSTSSSQRVGTALKRGKSFVRPASPLRSRQNAEQLESALPPTTRTFVSDMSVFRAASGDVSVFRASIGGNSTSEMRPPALEEARDAPASSSVRIDMSRFRVASGDLVNRKSIGGNSTSETRPSAIEEVHDVSAQNILQSSSTHILSPPPPQDVCAPLSPPPPQESSTSRQSSPRIWKPPTSPLDLPDDLHQPDVLGQQLCTASPAGRDAQHGVSDGTRIATVGTPLVTASTADASSHTRTSSSETQDVASHLHADADLQAKASSQAETSQHDTAQQANDPSASCCSASLEKSASTSLPQVSSGASPLAAAPGALLPATGNIADVIISPQTSQVAPPPPHSNASDACRWNSTQAVSGTTGVSSSLKPFQGPPSHISSTIRALSRTFGGTKKSTTDSATSRHDLRPSRCPRRSEDASVNNSLSCAAPQRSH
jgi:hypothetical protein